MKTVNCPRSGVVTPISRRRLAQIKNSSAFNRTELVVTLAILVVLAALIAGWFSVSKVRAAGDVCLANLKSLGVAGSMYAQDNQGYFAYADWNGGKAGGPAGWLYKADVNGVPDPTRPPYNDGSNGLCYSSGTYLKYMPDTKSYLCPEDIKDPNFLQRKNKLSSYVMNGAVTGFAGTRDGHWLEGRQLAKVNQVTNTLSILMWEADTKDATGHLELEYDDGANFPGSNRFSWYNENIAPLHSKDGGQVLTIDGHVESYTRDQFRCQSEQPGLSLLWWSPFSDTGHF